MKPKPSQPITEDNILSQESIYKGRFMRKNLVKQIAWVDYYEISKASKVELIGWFAQEALDTLRIGKFILVLIDEREYRIVPMDGTNMFNAFLKHYNVTHLDQLFTK